MEPVLIVGCGYVGRRVALAELREGRGVSALVRSEASASALCDLGVHARRTDLDDPASTSTLPAAGATLYYFAPPPPTGVTDPRLRNFLASLTSATVPKRIVLISTSGVYGDCRGEWVAEERPPLPQADRARRRLDAENELQAWASRHAVETVILRVPGIYGPGRLPRARIVAGEPVLRAAESPWSNRVHIDDLVRACLAAARGGRPGAVYNVADGAPTTMTDYFNRVADALGLPRPPQIGLAEAGPRLGEGMRSYLAESKRLDIRRLREELGVVPQYPDLARGLAACVAEIGRADPAAKG